MAEDKKIIIDEDWKSQVQAEKEAAAKQTVGAGANDVPGSAGAEVAATSTASSSDGPALPPASFEMLVTTLATEALVALGQMPHPATGALEMERNQAQFLIDTLEVLQQKTKGNLNAAEQQLIDSVLHQMRMIFIAVANKPASSAT